MDVLGDGTTVIDNNLIDNGLTNHGKEGGLVTTHWQTFSRVIDKPVITCVICASRFPRSCNRGAKLRIKIIGK